MPGVNVSRGTVLGVATIVAGAREIAARTEPEILELWPGAAPGAPLGGTGPLGPEIVSARGSVTNVSGPRLAVYRPERPNGTAAVVIAGGDYAHVEAGLESTPACVWLQSLGVTAFELIYRLPEVGWPPLAPFQDGQRALRAARVRAELHIFRSGGHGWGMGRPGTETWPALFAASARLNGFLPRPG
jgi:hypothetical protein